MQHHDPHLWRDIKRNFWRSMLAVPVFWGLVAGCAYLDHLGR
jgi:hypothetical protein